MLHAKTCRTLNMKYILSILLLTLVLLNCRSQDLVPFHVDTRWGYRDRQGTVKIQPQYQYARKFTGDIAIVAKNGKLGAIDKNNKEIISFCYEYLQCLDASEFLFGYRTKYIGNHIVGVMTKDEKVKIPAAYNSIEKYGNVYIVVKNKDSVIEKYGVYDVRAASYTYGLLDNNGDVVIPCKYDYVKLLTDTLVDVGIGITGMNHALFNIRGKQITGFEYMVLGSFVEGVAKARIGNQFGFIFPTGKVAIPVGFDYCEDFNNGYAIIKQKEKWGAINKKGEIVIDPKYDYQEVKNSLKEKYMRQGFKS
jgi:hypothetical protein